MQIQKPKLRVLNRYANNRSGFTLIEVIAVLVIAVIISAVIVSRSGSSSTDLVSQTEILKTHLRYVQTMSMSASDLSSYYGIKCEDGVYWMFKGTESNIIILPDDQRYINNEDKLDLSEKNIAIDTAFTVFFDQRGIPYTSYPDEPLTSNLSIDVKKPPGGETAPYERITITPLTGFIP